MDFSWSGEQEALHKSVREFSLANLNENAVVNDRDSVFPRQLWQQCVEFGVLRWSVSKGHGGMQYPVSTTAYLMEALGYGCRDNGLMFALGAQMWGVQMALTHFGSHEQIKKYLVPMLGGEALGAYAMTEIGSGSDAFSLQTTAMAHSEGYVLNGEKTLITLSPIATFAIVFAVTDSEAGRWGLSAFLVNSDSPGYLAHGNEQKMGLRTVPFGRISLEDCYVPRSAMLGKSGAGASIFNYSQGLERGMVLAPQIGAMRRQLEQCIKFSKSRRRAGYTLGKYQNVSHRIANMKIRLEIASLLLYKTAISLERNEHATMESAITKTYISEAFTESSRDAIAIFGGAGYVTENAVERDLRDAIGGTIYGGTSDIQRNIIAALQGL